jgi:uncharacterized membrane protein YcjF (UPF0283 family)
MNATATISPILLGISGIALLILGSAFIFFWADSSLQDDWRGNQWLGWSALVAGLVAIILGVHCLSWLRAPSVSVGTSLAQFSIQR